MKSFVKRVFPKNKTIKDDKEHIYSRTDYDSTFVVTKKILKLVTIQMTHNLSTFSSRCWDAFYWFEFANLFVALTSEFISMVQTARGGSFQDAVKIFRMMPCFGFVLLAMFKSFTMVYHRPVYENLINELGDMWPSGSVTEEEHEIVNKAVKELHFVINGYHWCNNGLLISFLSPPFYESIKRALGYENQMLLHFFYWLPFDPFQHAYIDIVLLIQTWHALVVIWSNLCGDLLFCSFLSHITTQFDLLSLRIRKLFYVPIDRQLVESYPLRNYSAEYIRNERNIGFINDADWEEKHKTDLTNIIIRHQALIRLSNDVENMFNVALLVNFMNSSVIICFCGFCCVVVEKWNDIAYKLFLLTSLSQTFLLCFHGQKLLDSSEGISHALYNSGWYRASQKIKRSVFIMLCRAQKKVHITTYGFSVISLTSYTMIMKSAWSYFTLLLNTYKQ